MIDWQTGGLGAVELRQLTLFWQPIVTINTYPIRSSGLPERAVLDLDSCALELVVILSLGLIYFCWLDGRLSTKRSIDAGRGNAET